MISYDKFIKRVPKETRDYVNDILDFLHDTDDLLIKISGDKISLDSGTADNMLFKALSLYYKVRTGDIRKYIKELEWESHSFTVCNNNLRAEKFKRYIEYFTPYEDENEYYFLTSEDIFLTFLQKLLNKTTYIKRTINSPEKLYNWLDDVSKKIKKEYEEEIKDECIKNFSAEKTNYLITTAKIYSYLKKNNLSHSNNENLFIAFLLSIFKFKYISKYDDVYNEQKRIIKYLESKGITLELIENKFGIKIDYTKINEIAYVGDLKEICDLDFIKNHSLTNKIGYIFIHLVIIYLKNNPAAQKILNNFDLTIDSFNDVDTVIDDAFYINYTKTAEEIYKDINKTVTITVHRLNKIYTYLLLKRENLNKDYISSNQEIMVLALLLLSYEYKTNISTFFEENNMSLNLVLETIGLPKEEIYKKELETTEEIESLVVRFNDLLFEGKNHSKKRSYISVDDLFNNLASNKETETTFINALFTKMVGKDLEDDFTETINKYFRLKEIQQKKELEERLLSNLSIDVCKFLKLACSYYNYYGGRDLQPEDREQLAIIIAALEYDKLLYSYFGTLGFNKTKISEAFNIHYEGLEAKMDIYVIDGPLKKYIFDRDPKQITIYSIFENAFNPKYKNSLKLRELLHKKGKIPEDFLDLNKSLNDYQEEEKRQEKEKEINNLFSNIHKDAKELVKIILKVYEKLTMIDNNNDRCVLSILYGILLDNNRYGKYFNNNGIELTSLSKIFGIDNKIFDEMETIGYLKETILEFKEYFPKYAVDDKVLIIEMFDNRVSHSNILNYISAKLNINYNTLKDEVTNRKEKEITPEIGIAILSEEKTKPIENLSIPTITEYGIDISKHFKYINNSLHQLVFQDSLSETITSLNSLIDGIVTEEEEKVSFLKTVFDPNYVPKTIKKYSPERLCDLENVIEGYIVTLRKELDCYVYLKKYIEIYLLKLEEYLNNLKSLTLNVPSSEDITSIDDILNYTKFLDQKSLRDILNGKINTFETMIMLMKQELVSVHQAIINHFITINSLTLSRSAILPLLTTEIAISVGNKTEKAAIELSNDLIGLLQSVVNKNYEDALANLEKLKTSSLSDDVILKLNEEVKRYLVTTSASQKLLESTDTTKDKSNHIQ